MLDLKMILEKYPRCMDTRSQLASLLRDLYPSEKREINVALAIYDSGITSKISKLQSIDTVQLHSFTKQLVDDFGLQEQFAVEGIAVWGKAYGLLITKGNVAPLSVASQDKITHSPDAYATQGMGNAASASDFELKQTPQGIVISKFRGFDEADVVVPNIIDGQKVIGIGESAYENCKEMKTLVISDGIEFIDDGAFSGCGGLAYITFPATLTRIGSSKAATSFSTKGAFERCRITEVSLPADLQILGGCTFKDCFKLISIDIPHKITEIGDYTFWGCRSLSEVILPESLSKIGDSAFAFCIKLTHMPFPLLLSEIGNKTFYYCYDLSSIVLNASVKKIGNSAFEKCNKLTIYCYAGSYGLEYARKHSYPIQNAENFSI